MNFFTGSVSEGWFHLDDIQIKIPEGKMKMLRDQNYIGEEVVLGIRPEEIHDELVFIQSTPDAKITATVDVAELMGAETYLYSKVNNQTFVARIDSRTDITGGEKIELAFDMNKAHFFNTKTQELIYL